MPRLHSWLLGAINRWFKVMHHCSNSTEISCGNSGEEFSLLMKSIRQLTRKWANTALSLGLWCQLTTLLKCKALLEIAEWGGIFFEEGLLSVLYFFFPGRDS